MPQGDAVTSANPSRRRFIVIPLLALPLLSLSGAARATGLEGEHSAATGSTGEQINQLLYQVPLCQGRTDVAERIQERARQEEMNPPTIRALEGDGRVRLADGRPIPVELRRLEIAGRDSYSKLHYFLSRMVLWPFLTDLQQLEVKAEDGGTVSYSARLAFPCYSKLGEDEALSVSEGELGTTPFVTIARYEGYLRAYLQKLSELTDRANPARLTEALAAFDRLSGSRPIALTALRLSDETGEVALEGAYIGSAKSFDPSPLLEQAGFRVRRHDPKDDGACRRFSIAARLEPKIAQRSPDDLQEVVSDNGPFDAETAEICGAAPEPSFGRISLRGTAGSPATPPTKGAIVLRLRDVDVSDLILALHEATGEGFVVAPGLHGRVSVDLEGASFEQAVSALAEAGIAVGPGPLRRVALSTDSRSAAIPAASGDAGEPIDMTIRRTDMEGFLCTLSMVLQRPIAYPRDLAGSITVFGSEMPVRRLLETVAALSGYSLSERGKELVIGAGGVHACAAKPAGPSQAEKTPSRLRERLEMTPALNELQVADLELAGLVQTAEGWQAYVCAPPSRRLLRLHADQELRAAKVKEIRPDGVTFTVTEGASPFALTLRE